MVEVTKAGKVLQHQLGDASGEQLTGLKDQLAQATQASGEF